LLFQWWTLYMGMQSVYHCNMLVTWELQEVQLAQQLLFFRSFFLLHLNLCEHHAGTILIYHFTSTKFVF
jgi:hypothetical protein